MKAEHKQGCQSRDLKAHLGQIRSDQSLSRVGLIATP